METVRMGVIGAGSMGIKYCEMMLSGEVPEMTLVAVTSGSGERRAWLRAHLPEAVAVLPDAASLFASGLCDAVLIATPHALHPGQAMDAFRHRLHVLLEKPAGVDTRSVGAMNRAAREGGLRFAMMFNQRTNPIYRRIREIVSSGTLGNIQRVNWIITDWFRPQCYFDAGAWRATWAGEGGGVLINQCVHNLDLLQWICGMPERVQAFCHAGKWHDIEVEDDVTAYLEYASGATGVLVTSTGDAPGTNRLEITGEQGRLLCEAGRVSLSLLTVPAPVFSAGATGAFDRPESREEAVDVTGDNPQHVGILRNFAAAVLRGEALIAPGEEGLHSLMLSNAMYLSSWLGQMVSLPVDEGRFLEELARRQALSPPKAGPTVYGDVTGSFKA